MRYLKKLHGSMKRMLKLGEMLTQVPSRGAMTFKMIINTIKNYKTYRGSERKEMEWYDQGICYTFIKLSTNKQNTA